MELVDWGSIITGASLSRFNRHDHCKLDPTLQSGKPSPLKQLKDGHAPKKRSGMLKKKSYVRKSNNFQADT